jgi:hypothetical protein
MEEIMQIIRPAHTLLVLMAILALSACAPAVTLTQTSAPPTMPATISPIATTPGPVTCSSISASNDVGLTLLVMPDGVGVYLGSTTDIEFTPGGYCPSNETDQVVLRNGQVAIRSLLPLGESISVTSHGNFIATINDTGLVSYDPTSGIFQVSCSNGSCTLGTDLRYMNSLACGESGFLDSNGSFSGPFPVDQDSLAVFGDWLLSKCLQTATSTPTPPVGTPDTAATATAYCASFNEQFPLTPCPPQP